MTLEDVIEKDDGDAQNQEEEEDAEEIEAQQDGDHDEEESGADDADEDDEDEEDDDGETIIFLGDEEPEEEDDSPVIRKMRKELREKNKKLKEYEAKLATGEKEDKLPDKPKLEDFDFDADQFEAALDDWHSKKVDHDRRASERERQQRAEQEQYQKRLDAYNEEKQSLGVKDFDDLEASVVELLTPQQQGMIVTAAIKPAAVIAALGQHPKRLAEMAKISDPVQFIAETVRLEMSMKTMTKKKPAPEKRIESRTTQFRGTTDKKLEALEKEAERTGDRTEVLRYKREMKRA